MAVIVAGTGCSSRSKSQPPPEAVKEADRVARMAAQMQVQENWVGAAQAWAEAARQFQLINRMDQVAMARHNEAMARREIGEVSTARVLLEEAATLNRQAGQVGVWWRNQVALLQIENEVAPDAAAQRFEALTQVADTLPPEVRVKALLAHEEARLRAAQGRWDEALDASLRAAQGFAEIEDRAGWAAAMVTRAGFLRRQNRLPEAVATWREALRAYEELAYPRGIAVAMFGLGSALAAADPTPEAMEMLRRSAENFRALKREKDARAAEAELQALRAKGGAATR